MTTLHLQPSFVPKQYGNGNLFIAIEPMRRPDGFPEGLFAFSLPQGTSYDKAREIAKYLDENLSSFSYTR